MPGPVRLWTPLSISAFCRFNEVTNIEAFDGFIQNINGDGCAGHGMVSGVITTRGIRRWIIFLSGLALVVFSSGCGSLATRTFVDSYRGPYPGVRFDFDGIAHADKEHPAFYVPGLVPFDIIELSLSGAVDTVFLPFDLFEHQPEREPGFPGVRKYVVQYPHPVDQVLKAARTVVKKHGRIEEESKIKKGNTIRTIRGTVNRAVVWMGVEEITPGVTQLSMQALGSWAGTDRELIRQLDTEIAFELTKQPGIYFFQKVLAPEFQNWK